MNTSDASRLVAVSAIFTFGFGFLNSFNESKSKGTEFPSSHHVRLFVGTGILYVVLSALADTQPKIAGPFAVLIMTTALVTQAIPVIEQLELATGFDLDEDDTRGRYVLRQRPAVAPGPTGQFRPT